MSVERPNFIGIGAARAGTTWLDAVMRSHPGLCMPRHRKEIHYFDRYYDRGDSWYESFFKDCGPDQLAGEITPRYLFDPQVPQRIYETVESVKFLCILRDPVRRAISHYNLKVRDDALRAPLRAALNSEEEILEYGRYARQLTRYFELFGRESTCVLIMEEVFADPRAELDVVSDFLGVDSSGFVIPEAAINTSVVPRFPRLRRSARRVALTLRERGMDRVVEVAKAGGANRAFDSSVPIERPDSDVIRWLQEYYRADVEHLEVLLDRPLDVWRQHWGADG